MRSVGIKLWFGLILLLAPIISLQAQGQQVTPYVISSTVGARARACPTLDCEELFRFEHNDEIGVLATVTGNTVSGSDEWLEVATETGVVYVHSSLARPLAGVAPHNAVLAGAAPAAVTQTISTNGWNYHEAGEIYFRAPRGLNDAVDFFSDRVLLEELATMYGEDPDDLIDGMEAMFESESFDGFLLDSNTGTSIFVSHEDVEDIEYTLNLLERLLTRNEEDAGSTIVDTAQVNLPLGGAVRLHLIRTSDFGDSKSRQEVVLYAFTVAERIYYFEVAIDPSLYDDFLLSINTIASTISTEPLDE